MRVVLANQPQEQYGNHRYNLWQFGYDAAEGARAFATYCEQFGFSSAHVVGKSRQRDAARAFK
jgi:hypothetical protein